MGKDRSGRGVEEGDLGAPARRIYGRRIGRPLRQRRQAALDELLPRLQVSLPADGTLDPRSLFPADVSDIWLEIGSGDGEHAVWQASANPTAGYIAVEPFVNGIAGLLAMVMEQRLENVRVLMDDARLLLRALEPASIGRCFILFPDPWPKRRHWERRIVCREVLDLLALVMRPGAELRIGTDVEAYLVWILRAVRQHPEFLWQPEGADDWRVRPADWPETRFETKGREAGRRSTYLSLRRR